MAKPDFDIRLLGSKKLQKKLNKLDKRMAGKLLKGAMKDALQPVQVLAKQRVPVDRGLLRKSIRIAMWGRRFAAGAVVRTGTRKQLKIRDDDPYYYPAAIEYGARFKGGKIRLARSFLRSSLYDRRKVVLNRVKLEIARRLERP